jgi:hypothetical protein
MGAAQADTLLIEKKNQDVQVETPRRGIDMNQVKSRFGEPKRTFDAVGEPPISRWQYNDFIVYFEYDKVLHSVMTNY